MTISTQEVIAAAIQLEEDGRKFYLEAAEGTDNEVVKQTLKSLAEDELLHIQWIKNNSPGDYTAGKAKKETYERLKGIFAEVPEEVKRKTSVAASDTEAMKIAFDMEEKSVKAYEQWAEEAEAEQVKSLCKMLAEIEKFHRELITNTLYYLNHTGDWFMEQENWIFDGG